MSPLDSISEQAFLPEKEHNQNECGKKTLETHSKVIDPKNGGIPVGVEGHQPVERGKGQGNGKEKEARSAGPAHQGLQAPVAGFVHLDRFVVQPVSQEAPKPKVDELPDNKKGGIQVGQFPLQYRIAGYRICVGPVIK